MMRNFVSAVSIYSFCRVYIKNRGLLFSILKKKIIRINTSIEGMAFIPRAFNFVINLKKFPLERSAQGIVKFTALKKLFNREDE